MMDKRYQIFISSTFVDLQDERAKVQNMIMQLGYIPAGMELFPAIDEEQLEFIKKIIDDSDYYLLIIGGRYGSVAKDGISYTEREYDYAVSKGMKVIALIHEKPDSLPLEKSEKDAKARKSLERFKKKVKQGRIVLFWRDASELPGKLAQSLPVTIKTYPAIGWVRANTVPAPEVYKELNDLRKENDNLKEALNKQATLEEAHNLAGLSDEVKLSFAYSLVGDSFMATDRKMTLSGKWQEIFTALAPRLLMHMPDRYVKSLVSDYFKEKGSNFVSKRFAVFEIIDADFEVIRIQLRALDLIILYNGEEEYFGNTQKAIIWCLTPAGEKLLVIEKALRKVE